MKNRKKNILPSKPVFKRSDPSIEKNCLNNFSKRLNLSSISLQQNFEFYQQQSNLFRKPSLNYGDADTYFKQTLRSYDYCDFRSFKASIKNRLPKKTKSSETLRKPGSSLKPTNKLKSPQTAETTKSSKTEVQFTGSKPQELDLDIFYSPSSHTLTNSLSSSRTLKDQSTEDLVETQPTASSKSKENHFKNKSVVDMAEEEEYIPEEVEEEDEEGEDEENEDEEMAEEEDGGIEEVEQMIDQASKELEEVAEENAIDNAEENAEIINAEESEETEEEEITGAEEEEGEGQGDGHGSVFKFDPAIDDAVLRELEEAEQQAKATATIIHELKDRVTELLKKEKHTEEEAKELEAKNKELKAQMTLFEEKTKRIQFLIAQTNLFEQMTPLDTPLQQMHKEDVLPKVIVCGITENNIPKIILCDGKKVKENSSSSPCGQSGDNKVNIPMSVVPKFAKRLSDSYTMQERLATENADLEGMRYKLQADLLCKDQTIEYLQRKLCAIQSEMRLLCKENSTLNNKVQVCKPDAKSKKAPCGKGKGICPADIEGRLNEYSETTKVLEQQLCDMENDVKCMQSELTAVQAEREHLEQHKKMTVCSPPLCAPMPCGISPCPPVIVGCSDFQLRELTEKYLRLQDDFKSKVTEVGGLRADNEKLKTSVKDAEEGKKSCEEKVRELERTIKAIKGEGNKMIGSKEQMIELEQQLNVAKQRFREAQDELEELRSFVQDQQAQLDDYRHKYLEAQQEVEEQRRKIDILEMNANRVNEEINIEINRVKAQFQEKLQELAPLPELLQSTQIKLQEVQQMHLLAERNNDALHRELQLYKDKIAEITDQMDRAQSDQTLGTNERLSMAKRLEEAEQKIQEREEDNLSIRAQLNDTTVRLVEVERDLDAKVHEIVQLEAQLESVREESARQVARNKERCETVRRSMQNQISDLERQLALSRAQARSIQKDRDEIRQKMQSQISNLHENFEDAQMRIRSLQGHVNFLKDSYQRTSCNVTGDNESQMSDHQDPCCCTGNM